MDPAGDSQFGKLFGFQRREREDAGRGVEVGPADETMVEALLQRLELPADEQNRVERTMRMEKMP